MASDRQNDIRMPGEFLDNLTSLQIPNVNAFILRTANDPLAAGHRKSSKNAVRFVTVTDVSFEDSIILTGPKPNIIIPSGSKDELSIGREFNKSDCILFGVFFIDNPQLHVIMNVPNDDIPVETT